MTLALTTGTWAAIGIGALIIVVILIRRAARNTFDDGTFDDSRKDKKPR